jgi:hypothetical protein
LIGVLRALDQRIARVSTTIATLSEEPAARDRAACAQRRELSRRLADLQAARRNLVDVVFRG